MSLEVLIAENTAAMKALTIALASHHIPATAGAAPAPAPKNPPAQPPQPKAQGGALDYDKDVKPLTLRVAKEKSREKVVEILSKFGVANANLLKAEQYGDFITACNKALSEK